MTDPAIDTRHAARTTEKIMTDDARINAVAKAIGFCSVDIHDAMSPRQLVDAFDVLIRAHDAAQAAPASIDRERVRAALIYLAEWAGLSIRGAIEVLGEDGYPDIAALLDERTEKGGER